MTLPTAATIFDATLSDEFDNEQAVTMPVAEKLFNYFKNLSVFKWIDASNDCEDRANAICILLDEWNIPNYKGWVFSGFFKKKNFGSLINLWNYHVAALLPVQTGNAITFFIIDPATSNQLQTIEQWAFQITSHDKSYHFIKSGKYFIFPTGNIKKHNWYKRNKRNHRWTIQGLSGINGISATGKAQLAFNKAKIKRTEEIFKTLKKEKPLFLHEAEKMQKQF